MHISKESRLCVLSYIITLSRRLPLMMREEHFYVCYHHLEPFYSLAKVRWAVANRECRHACWSACISIDGLIFGRGFFFPVGFICRLWLPLAVKVHSVRYVRVHGHKQQWPIHNKYLVFCLVLTTNEYVGFFFYITMQNYSSVDGACVYLMCICL